MPTSSAARGVISKRIDEPHASEDRGVVGWTDLTVWDRSLSTAEGPTCRSAVVAYTSWHGSCLA